MQFKEKDKRDPLHIELNVQPTPEPKFIKLYFDDISKLYSLSKNATTFFYETMKFVTYNPQDSIHNLIYFTSSRKKILYKKLTDNPSTAYTLFMRAKKELIDADLLIEIVGEGDTFLVNSFIASKANWANTEVMQSIQLIVNYENSGKTLSTVVKNNKEMIKKELEIRRDLETCSAEEKENYMERIYQSTKEEKNNLNK